MKIIGIGRRKGVGKDTLASYLKPHFPGARVVGIADKVKAIAHDLYGWAGLKDGAYYETNYSERAVVLPQLGKSARQIWIELGTSVGRELWHDTWIRQLLYEYRDADTLIIKDVRFQNEIDVIRNLGGFLIEVENLRIPAPTDVADTQNLQEGWQHITVDNSYSLTDLSRTANKLAPYIKEILKWSSVSTASQ